MRKKLFNNYSEELVRDIRSASGGTRQEISQIFDEAIQRAWNDREKFRATVLQRVRLPRGARKTMNVAPMGTAISQVNYKRLKALGRMVRRDMATVVEVALRAYLRSNEVIVDRRRNGEKLLTPAFPVLISKEELPPRGREWGNTGDIKEGAYVFLDWTVVFVAMISSGTSGVPAPFSDCAYYLVSSCVSPRRRGFMTTTGVNALFRALTTVKPNPDAHVYSTCIGEDAVHKQSKAELKVRLSYLLGSEIVILPVMPEDFKGSAEFAGTRQFEASIDLLVAKRNLPKGFALVTTTE